MAKGVSQADQPDPPEREGQDSARRPVGGSLGAVEFTEAVLIGLVQRAMAEIEGLGSSRGKLTHLVGSIGGRQRGIQVEQTDGGLHVSLNIAVRYGKPVHETARELQQHVKTELEAMTGLEVVAVDVYVQDVQTETEEGAMSAETSPP